MFSDLFLSASTITQQVDSTRFLKTQQCIVLSHATSFITIYRSNFFISTIIQSAFSTSIIIHHSFNPPSLLINRFLFDNYNLQQNMGYKNPTIPCDYLASAARSASITINSPYPYSISAKEHPDSIFYASQVLPLYLIYLFFSRSNCIFKYFDTGFPSFAAISA